MAQDQNKGNQQQAQGPQNRTTVSDPFTDPVAYLRGKGWKCLGDPTWSNALWLDPTKPLRAETRKTKRFGWVRQTMPGEFEKNGAPVIKAVWKQLEAQDGSGIPNKMVPIEQLEVTPKVEPILMQYALMIQMERDLAESTPPAKQAS